MTWYKAMLRVVVSGECTLIISVYSADYDYIFRYAVI